MDLQGLLELQVRASVKGLVAVQAQEHRAVCPCRVTATLRGSNVAGLRWVERVACGTASQSFAKQPAPSLRRHPWSHPGGV